MIVYELSWWYLDEESGKSDEQVIAVYSSEQLAQKAIERFKTQPRFIGHEEDFYISKYIINHEEWKDGYFCSDDLNSPANSAGNCKMQPSHSKPDGFA